jgi:RNA polymerase sigma-70 factor (ECF subfamily)
LPFEDASATKTAMPVPAPERHYAKVEQADSVKLAIAELKPKFRLPILLKYVEELSYEEIASVLGCSKGTVASRLNRGHKQLARRLAHLRDQVALGD